MSRPATGTANAWFSNTKYFFGWDGVEDSLSTNAVPLYITTDGAGGSNDNIIIEPNGSGQVAIGTTSPNQMLTIGQGGWNMSPEQAIHIQESGVAEPTADGTNSVGDKLVLWNQANCGGNCDDGGGVKTAIGIGPWELWFQASGDPQSHTSFFRGADRRRSADGGDAHHLDRQCRHRHVVSVCIIWGRRPCRTR
jgi:hypothetical protein